MTCNLMATLKFLRQSSRFAVIGYGNQLRDDDAIGPLIAARIAQWNLPYVRTVTVHQLTPELAETLAAVDCAIFVDACRTSRLHADVRVTRLEPVGCETTGSSVPVLGHTSDPRSLLALTQSVYGRHPRAWWVEVPAEDFGVGDRLSSTAERGMADALEEIEGLIRRLRQASVAR